MSIDNVIRPRRVRQPGSAASHVVDHVEPLEERHAVDEVQAAASYVPEVVHDEVDRARAAADRGVEGTL